MTGDQRSARRLLLATATALLLSGCGDEAGENQRAPTVDVLVTAVEPRPVDLADELPGRVVAWRVAEIRPQVGGIVQRRLFEQGADVRAGQPLFQINPAPFRADANSAAASLDRARAVYALARIQADRLKPLVDADAISRQGYDNAVAQRDQAAAAMAVARADFARRRLDLGFARITSPIAGRIGAALVTEGALVAAQDPNPLATVQQIDKVYVDVRQPAERFDALRDAMAAGKGPKDARVHILSTAGAAYPESGRILFSGVAVDSGTGNVVVRVAVDNPQRRLLPGMFVRARLPRMTLSNALTVPQEAVLRDGTGQANVGVVDSQGRVRDRAITVGEVVDGRYIVLSGLKRGETVVVVGRDRIQPGVPVNPQPWHPANR